MESSQKLTQMVFETLQVNYYKNFIENINFQKTLGKSLLPLLDKEPLPSDSTPVFGSHNYHEITMSYPMRTIRSNRYKLIHNINFNLPFPIDQDFYVSWTFQDILNRTISKTTIPWYKTLKSYYYRPEFELFDLKTDPIESINVAYRKDFSKVRKDLEDQLKSWQVETKDPWRCAPNAVLEGDTCMTLGHDEI
jgi:N-sulfoglucosamine sulfohydrolase